MDVVNHKVEEGKKAGVVYEIGCGTCEQCCRGKTPRSAETGVKEHCTHARIGHPELSAVGVHVLEGHKIEWKPKIVEVAGKMRVQWIKETVIQEINKSDKVTLNRDKGVELSPTWLDLV